MNARLRWAAGGTAVVLIVAGAVMWQQAPRPVQQSVPETRLVASAVAPARASTAAAQTPHTEEPEPTREERRRARYDKDKDGQVSREEYLASRRKAYAKLDRDGDGRLSFEEYAISTSDRFAQADSDRNGRLSPAEFATTARKPAPRKCDCPQKPDEDA